ncbi:hypothetical protein [Paracidovorax citrulli]|uniref:hypothetical protein n=1 Tax=Paracidovorax citrulli TaxID=80869 RepID=UPI00126A6B53|nr:hypothetical protein [Paracidovorax citrulli]
MDPVAAAAVLHGQSRLRKSCVPEARRAALFHNIDSKLEALSSNRSRITNVLQHQTSHLIPPRDLRSLKHELNAIGHDRHQLEFARALLEDASHVRPRPSPLDVVAGAYAALNSANRHLARVDDQSVLDDREIVRGLHEFDPEFLYPRERD